MEFFRFGKLHIGGSSEQATQTFDHHKIPIVFTLTQLNTHRSNFRLDLEHQLQT